MRKPAKPPGVSIHASALAGAALGIVASVGGAQQMAVREAGYPYRITGSVTDSASRPVLGAEISLEANGRILAVARSRANGRFELTGVPRTATLLRVRRLGYHPYSEELAAELDAPAKELTLLLRAAVVDVAPVVVEERVDRSQGRLREFYEHKRSSRLGVFIERDQIARRDVSHASELLRNVRGVQIRAHSGVGNRVRLRGCRPMIWLNGLRILDAELDEVAHPADIEAIEIYLSIAGMPAQFIDHIGKCGAIAIWTSDGEHRDKIAQ